MECPRCRVTLKAPSRFCAECGAAIASGASTIEASPRPRRPSNDPLEARFIPGTMLGDRYRIVSLIGHGGMGEVYRAEDLRLGQVVALKFLPEEVARDADRLTRFHGEVRVARQISPIRMSVASTTSGRRRAVPSSPWRYVDGDDLAVLLRRVGRLPAERAMSPLRARVQRGRLVLDEPTNLPEGTELELVADDEGDDLTEEERQALHDALSASGRSAEGGKLRPGAAILDELRRRR